MSRPILPQTTSSSSMQSFTFTPPNMGLGDAKKNYVFVDEHNRHKRLKVMRACEGCRRRKIKCDAATTNTWPCAACVRLKLTCVPPTMNYNRSEGGGSSVSGLERVLDFDASSSGDEDYMDKPYAKNLYQLDTNTPGSVTSHPGYANSMVFGHHHANSFSSQDARPMHMRFDSMSSMPIAHSDTFSHASYPMSSAHSVHVVENNESWVGDDMSASNLSDVLGELKIDESGVAPYIFQQKKTLAEAPALEEFEYALPGSSTGSGTTVRIPPELMPDDEQASEYFDIFFNDLHPYVPVISKAYFMQQWNTNRRSISPLLLEAIFACAGRMSDDAAQGAQWLALASKHENCFMDVPRLSTIQALIILLKAREAAPKRGYYYRSWMTVKTLVAMAKDLELHEHFADHQAGRGCGSDPTECLVKTRIWQTIFVIEIMIGGPQGRFDMGVDAATVAIDTPAVVPGADPLDVEVSRQYNYLVRTVRDVRLLHDGYIKTRKEKDWGSSPIFVGLTSGITKWLDTLPPDMQIHYPPDGTAPYVPSHFIANVHVHHQLTLIALYRPQLMSASSFDVGGSWKLHMAMCYDAAKTLCRLQEAILQSYGINGMLFMQRGINFAIYCILTCTMLHLVAITSPDPDFNTDAREYFTRHMRIMENCISAWPMPDMQAQIQSLREAFSADCSKPFELKRSFPYGSPAHKLEPSPPLDFNFGEQMHGNPQIALHTTPITPPISAGHDDKESVYNNSMMSMPRSQPTMTATHLGDEQMQWNPKGIFDQWNTAFGTPVSSLASNPIQSPSSYSSSSTVTTHDLTGFTPTDQPSFASPNTHHHSSSSSHQLPTTLNTNQYSLPSQVSPITPAPGQSTFTSQHAYVSPAMWQDTVADTFDPSGSLKRRWSRTNILGAGQLNGMGTWGAGEGEQSAKRVR